MDRQKVFDYCLKAFLFLSPLFFFRTYQISFARGLFFVLGTFVLLAVSLSLEPRRRLSNIWVSAFLLLALVNIFFKGNLGPVNQEWFNFWFSCAGFIYVLTGVLLFKTVYCYADNIKQYFYPIVSVCIVNLLLVTAQLSGMDFMWTHAPSASGFMESQSQLGQYSALSLPVLFYINPLLALIPLFTLFISKSISAILAGSIGLIILCIGYKVRKIIIAGLIAVLIFIGYINFGYIQAKFACRPVMWQKTLKVAMQKPYLGHGYNSFNDKVLKVGSKCDIGKIEYSRAHNDLIHTAQELGFPILIVLGIFFMKLFKKFIAIKNKDRLLICIASSVLIALINGCGQTLIRYSSVASIFIILLALLCVEVDDAGRI